MVTLSGERSTGVKRALMLNGVKDPTSDHASSWIGITSSVVFLQTTHLNFPFLQ